ncbi:MAG: hypothetical protein JNJ54_35420 [Myxococcaceae bacterium]|nr:hypothetical protein [Myxococcaceae bacterium]
MAETACPFCAFSPIATGAEACPRCRRKFVDDVADDTSVTATRAGGITGAVTASPVPVAIALVLGAVAWLLRVLDVFTVLKDPTFLLAVPVLLIAGAASVMAAAGPAKHLPAVLGLVCLAATGLWWTKVPLHNVAFAAFGALVLLGTLSEPSSLRLRGASLLAGASALVGLVALALGPASQRPDAVGASLMDEQVGLRWALPAGWGAATALSGGLEAPRPSPRRAVLLANNQETTQAFLVLDRAPGPSACDALVGGLGASVLKTSDEAPPPFPRGTMVLEIQGSAGAVRAACAAPGGKPLLAVVVSSTGPEAVVEASLRVLASGAAVLADPTGP